MSEVDNHITEVFFQVLRQGEVRDESWSRAHEKKNLRTFGMGVADEDISSVTDKALLEYLAQRIRPSSLRRGVRVVQWAWSEYVQWIVPDEGGENVGWSQGRCK